LRKKLAQQQKLLKQLERDLKSHEDAEQHKRVGDLLLANLTTGRREGNRVELVDYFADDGSTDKSISMTRLRFRKKRIVDLGFTRAQNARSRRSKCASPPLRSFARTQVGTSIAEKDIDQGIWTRSRQHLRSGGSKNAVQKIPGTRRYLSSDGFEILVGAPQTITINYLQSR
jgi:predicted ribosome quality control (RQC) complex YloA/Tae2 family protein